MPAWLRNVRVNFLAPVIIGCTLAAIIVPWVNSLLANVWWWPLAWVTAYVVIGRVLVHWFCSQPSRR